MHVFSICTNCTNVCFATFADIHLSACHEMLNDENFDVLIRLPACSIACVSNLHDRVFSVLCFPSSANIPLFAYHGNARAYQCAQSFPYLLHCTCFDSARTFVFRLLQTSLVPSVVRMFERINVFNLFRACSFACVLNLHERVFSVLCYPSSADIRLFACHGDARAYQSVHSITCLLHCMCFDSARTCVFRLLQTSLVPSVVKMFERINVFNIFRACSFACALNMHARVLTVFCRHPSSRLS